MTESTEFQIHSSLGYSGSTCFIIMGLSNCDKLPNDNINERANVKLIKDFPKFIYTCVSKNLRQLNRQVRGVMLS